jgi:hypothetical protein
MEKKDSNIIKHIPVQIPWKEIYSRLGYNIHLTEIPVVQKEKIDSIITDGFYLCEPQGLWMRMEILSRGEDHIRLENDDVIKSKSLSKMLKKSNSVVVMGATVGFDIIDASKDMIAKGDGSSALILDAVGSEVADGGVDWINDYLRQQFYRASEVLTKRRFSPGYSDLLLESQKVLYDILDFKKIEVNISDRYILSPEKSVIAIAGVEEIS